MVLFPECINCPLEQNGRLHWTLRINPPESRRSFVASPLLPLRSLTSLLPTSSSVLSFIHPYTRTILYLLFPRLVVNLLPVLCLISLVIFTYLFMIKSRTEKLVAVPGNLSAPLSNENSSQLSLPDSKPSKNNAGFVAALKDQMPSSQ